LCLQRREYGCCQDSDSGCNNWSSSHVMPPWSLALDVRGRPELLCRTKYIKCGETARTSRRRCNHEIRTCALGGGRAGGRVRERCVVRHQYGRVGTIAPQPVSHG